MEKYIRVGSKAISHSFLAGGGEAGQIVREHDWSASSIGPTDQWPQSLKTTLGILLHSAFPMLLFWGDDLICFYNDAFRPSLGREGKHPAIGKPGRIVWAEIWDFIYPLMEKVMRTGEPVWFEDQPVPFYRNGRIEEIFWTFSYSAAYDDDGNINGVFVTCTETTEKVKSTRAQKEIHQQLQNFVAQAAVGIVVITGEDMVVQVVNDAYSKLIGRTASELIGRPLFSFIPEVEKRFRPLLDQVRLTKEPLYMDEAHYSITSSGSEYEGYLDLVYYPYKNEFGEVIGVMALCQDVTEKVLSRKRIEESEQRFQAAVAAVEGVVWTCNADGRMTGEQRAWLELTGQTPDQYLGLGWIDAVHGEDATPTLEAWTKAVSERISFNFQHRLRVSNGEFRHFSIRAIPIQNDDGQVREWVGVHTDITELLKSENILKESEERFRSLADQSPMIVYIVEPNADAAMTYFNKTLLDYTGQTFEEALGRSWDGIVHPDDVDGILEIFAGAFRNRVSYTLPSVRLRRRDGAYRWHLFKGNPRYLSDGEFIGFVGVAIDIHDQKLAEIALKRNEEMLENLVMERTLQLERSNEDLQQFAHVASHDLKEPVRKILTFSERLRESAELKLNEKEKNSLGKVQSAAHRMASMIEGVLLYSSISGRYQKTEIVDLSRVFHDIENDLEVLIAQKDAVILRPDALPSVEGAGVLLYQLFYNLVNNSLKFSKSHVRPVITISSSMHDDGGRHYALVTLNDNGIGFDSGSNEKIFDKFTRLHSRDRFDGTGLGLALCRKIVTRHNGKVEAFGLPGEGATFNVTLPLTQRQAYI
jgi:PAS domain S-box-containing protein